MMRTKSLGLFQLKKQVGLCIQFSHKNHWQVSHRKRLDLYAKAPIWRDIITEEGVGALVTRLRTGDHLVDTGISDLKWVPRWERLIRERCVAILSENVRNSH